MAMEAAGKMGKVSEIFQPSVKKALKGKIIEAFTYKAFLRKTSKLSPNSQLYLNSGVSLLKHKQSKLKEYGRHRTEIKGRKKRNK